MPIFYTQRLVFENVGPVLLFALLRLASRASRRYYDVVRNINGTKWALFGLMVAGLFVAPIGAVGNETANPPEWYSIGYGVLSPVLGFQTFGKWRLEYEDTGVAIEEGSLRGGPTLGARLAGYKSLRSGHFQIGGTITYLGGFDGGWIRTLGDGSEVSTTLKQFLFAVSVKGGSQLGRCFWLGAGLDFGPLVQFTQSWEAETSAETDVTSDADMAVHFFPHASADFLLMNNGKLKLGITINAGIYLVPGIADIESSLSNKKEIQRYVTPVVNIGLMLGS